MKRRLIGGMLCAALALGFVPAAGAADGQTVKQMGLSAVERAVREGNATVRSLQNTAYAADSSSSIATSYTAQGGSMEAQITSYQSLIDGLDAAMQSLDQSSALYKTYEAQKKVLQGNLDRLQQSLNGLPTEKESTTAQIDDAVYDIQKQADNVADQLAMGAQDLLISIKTLQYSEEALERQIAALDRRISVLETKHARGMVSAFDLHTAQHQRESLALSLTNLRTQCEDLASSLALMCGYDAATLVMPSALAEPGSAELGKMRYEDDLSEALQNSFSIWQKQCDLRAAQNAYDENISGTAEAVASAKDALAAEKESVQSAFATTYRSVQDSQSAVQAAQTALTQAEREFAVSETKYQRGMASKQDYLDAQDTLDSAKADVETAQLSLITAYNQYGWAKKGLSSGSI